MVLPPLHLCKHPAHLDHISQHSAPVLTQVEDLVGFKARSSVVMAYGTSGTGKTFSIEVR
jgi:hypothetical protein